MMNSNSAIAETNTQQQQEQMVIQLEDDGMMGPPSPPKAGTNEQQIKQSSASDAIADMEKNKVLSELEALRTYCKLLVENNLQLQQQRNPNVHGNGNNNENVISTTNFNIIHDGWKLFKGKTVLMYRLCNGELNSKLKNYFKILVCQNRLFYAQDKLTANGNTMTLKIELCGDCVTNNITLTEMCSNWKKPQNGGSDRTTA